MKKQVHIIGAGLSGLYAACYLAKKGLDVTVLEKNESYGGRSRTFDVNGFHFDMGPSWYWMPELIDELIHDLGEERSDYYNLTRLNPGYRVFWKGNAPSNVPASFDDLYKLFETFEEEGGKKLEVFLEEAEQKYQIAKDQFLFQPGLKLSELVKREVFQNLGKMNLFRSIQKDVYQRFSSERARAILCFPSLFLGEMPARIPSLYSLMNHADLSLGTWYPEGGMSALAKALYEIALSQNVTFHFNESAEGFEIDNGKIIAVKTKHQTLKTNGVIGAADYHHIEQELLPKVYRKYKENYWHSRKMAPSCLIYYIGLSKKIPNLVHHNLFFDEDLIQHGKTIYETHSWPENPLFYTCVTSKTDENVAPKHGENVFLLLPVAPDIVDTDEIREKYFQQMIKRIKQHTGEDISEAIVYKRSYCVKDFKSDYNAFKGNAYGLANTLMQTANLKPKLTSKLENLFYCGQLTVPGPGVPPALISGQLAAKEILKKL